MYENQVNSSVVVEARRTGEIADDPTVTDTCTPEVSRCPARDKENVDNVLSLEPTRTTDKTPKRQGYLSWDDYFLSVAVLSSKRSKDPTSASGACIVDKQNRIVGIGYSGFPRGCSDSIFPWNDPEEDGSSEWLHTKEPYICHAISNSILNKCTNDVAGARIYVMEYPDCESAKVVIQSRIEEVVVLGDARQEVELEKETDEVQAGYKLLKMAGVKVRFCKPNVHSLSLDFVAKMSPTTTVAEVDDSSETSIVENFDQERKKRKVAERRVAKEILLEEAKYDSSKVDDNRKRKDLLSWQDYFMAMAFLTAQRSKDPNTQVGACIVDQENRIIGLGYNGFPSGCDDDHLPWSRSNKNQLDNKYLYVCHAEVNAILNKGSANVKGSTIYVALFPCQNCAKMIIQAGIREVVFLSDAYHDTPECSASRIMFKCAGVKCTQYIPSMQFLVLDLGLEQDR